MKKKSVLSMMLAFMMLFTSIPVWADDASTQVNQISLMKGTTIQLESEELESFTYAYVSSDESVAVVDENGQIQAVAEGSCEIEATAYCGEIAVGTKVTPVTVTLDESETDEGETGEGETGGGETGGGETEEEPQGITTFVFDGSKITVIDGVDTNYGIVDKAGDDVDAAGTDEDGNAYYVAAEEDIVAVEIGKKGGSYIFEGTATDSGISVKKEATNDAVLYLNGLDLTSSYTAPIVIKKDSTAKVSIIAMEGTVNKLTDNAYNNDDVYTDNGDAENAVIKAKAGSDVTIGGTGTLIVDGNGKNGIKAATKLTIEDVNLSVSAENNAIASDTELTIKSGTIYAECGNDGIKSCNDDTPIGSITIEGGDITIDSTGDCIVATNTVTITGGTFDLTAYDGYDAVYDGDDDSYPSAKGIKASGSYIVVDEEGTETEVDFVEENQLNITGGTFSINTADDAVHSDGDLTITGGTFEIWTGDDGIHSDYWTILGAENDATAVPSVKVMSCYEAVEGASVMIYGGNYEFYCSDDIINAANSDLTDWTYEITIHDGTFYGSTYMGDGYDSNSNLNLYGGTHVILSDTGLGEGNEGLDCDGSLTLAGATVLTIGRTGMGARYSSQTTNAYVAFGGGGGFGGNMGGFRPGQSGSSSSSSVSIASGDKVAVCDTSGNVLFETTAYWDEQNNGNNASYVMYSAPDLTSGTSYTLMKNDVQAATGTARTASSSGYSMAVMAANGAAVASADAATEETTLLLSVTQAEKPEISITYAYVSADVTVAEVSETGIVTGIEAGSATVTAETYINGVLVLAKDYEVQVISDEEPEIVEFAIVTQPKDVSVAKGETATVFVEATGEDLTYTWYYKNPGNNKFYVSGTAFVDGNTYNIPMYAWRDGQQVYCVITDANGNTLQTDTVTLTMLAEGIVIVTQPVDVAVAKGETATVSVVATGKDLTYTWYYKNPGNNKFYVSGAAFVDGNTYNIPMYAWRDGQQVYCVITDADGNTVQTNTATLTMLE